LDAGQSHSRVRAGDIAKEALEYHTRVRIPRHGRGGTPPRNVQVRTAITRITGAHAIDRVDALERELERCQLSLLAERLRSDLVQGNAQLERGPYRPFRVH